MLLCLRKTSFIITSVNEIKVILKKHGKINKYAVSLLQSHSGMNQDTLIALHSDFLTSLLREGYAVLNNAIEPQIAESLIVNYDKNIGYDPKQRAIRNDIGIGMRKTVNDIKLYKLPELMEGLYEIIRPAAQIWAHRVKVRISFPRKYSDFQKRCERVGQNDPVVVFRYEAASGAYVRFHSDPIGEVPFPFQFLGLLSDHRTFSGGDFRLRCILQNSESTFRLKLRRGDILIFPAGDFKRSNSRQVEHWHHGVSKVTRSERFSISFLLNQAYS